MVVSGSRERRPNSDPERKQREDEAIEGAEGAAAEIAADEEVHHVDLGADREAEADRRPVRPRSSSRRSAFVASARDRSTYGGRSHCSRAATIETARRSPRWRSSRPPE